MKGRILSILIFLIYQTNIVKGQLFVSSTPFSAATPFLEPDSRREILKISETEFVVASKMKGGLTGESTYSLEKYDTELKNLFKVPFTVADHEDIKDLFFNGTHIIVFTIIHNTSASESKLMAYGFNSSTGTKVWDKVMMQFKISPYQNVRSRGAVEESFENAVSSSINKSFIVPFEYQYEINYSPDRNKIIAYTFNYTKPGLIANTVIFDKNLNKIIDGIVPIDNSFINYGIHVNNRGDVYILNADKLGRIVLVQYNLESKDNKLMDIQYASTLRESLKLCIINDDEVFVGCTNTNDNKLTGIMYSKFNFKKNLVEKINFHELSDGIISTADGMRSSKNLKGSENWANFEMTHFKVNQYEKVLMVLEKRELAGYEYVYTSEAVLEPERWKERVAKVNAESVLMFSFNANDELMWENYYAKAQSNDVISGLISSSFVVDIDDETIRMVYASSNNATGIYNLYNYVQWDASNGNKMKDIELQNDESLALVRNYSIWFSDKLITVGRKGLLGKKYIMSIYKINPSY